VTGPNKAVHEGVLASKHGSVTVTTPRRVVRVHAHVIRVLGNSKKLIVVIVRSSGSAQEPRSLTASAGASCAARARPLHARGARTRAPRRFN
jgi:hypothetical protein